MQANTTKRKLKSGEIAYGTSLEDCLSPEMAVLLEAVGFDFFFIDTEHCAADYFAIQSLCRVAKGAGITPLVRVTNGQAHLITRALDVGAMGVIVPHVYSSQSAADIVQAIKFPPHGQRGYGLRSTTTDFHASSAVEEIKSCNRETMTVLQIECEAGLGCVEEIAAVDGVDALFIGPYDLTLSMGIVEQFEHPRFWKAVERTLNACAKAGIAGGLQASSFDMLRRARDCGARLLMYGNDMTVLLEGYRTALRMMKGTAGAAARPAATKSDRAAVEMNGTVGGASSY